MKQGLCGTGSGSAIGSSGVDYALTYSPGSGASGPAVFDTWTGLYDAILAVRAAAGGDSRIRVVIDDEFTALPLTTAGSYDFKNVVLSGLNRPTGFGRASLTIVEGTTFTNLYSFDSIQIYSTATATSPVVVQNEDFFIITNGADISNQGSIPLFDATGIGAGGFEFFTVLMTNRSTLAGRASGPLFTLGAPSFAIFDMSGSSVGNEGSFTGAGNVFLTIPDDASIMAQQPNSTATVNTNFGSVTKGPRFSYNSATTTITTTATVPADTSYIETDATGGTFTLTLPDIPTTSFYNNGRMILIKETSDTNSVTISPNGTDTIDGSTSNISLPRGGCIGLLSDGVGNWAVVTRITDSSRLGWIQFSDTQYTSASPLTLATDVRTQLTNNGGSVLNTNGPAEATGWLTTNKFTPDHTGDFYSLRVQFTADPTLNNRNCTIDIDIGGGLGIIWSKTIRLARGAGVDTKISEGIDLYTLSTFVANGGSINVTIDGETDIYDIIWLIHKNWRA